MKNILIPTDFSKNSKNSIRYALDLFQVTPCHFFLLYVNVEGSNFTEKPAYEFGTNILVELEPKAISQKLNDLEKFITSISSKKRTSSFYDDSRTRLLFVIYTKTYSRKGNRSHHNGYARRL